MPPHSEFVRAFNVAQFFELWAGSAEHILGTKREPTTQWMRPRDVEGLLRQDCESLASHAAPDDTTHSVTQGLCEIEARCIDLANALLQPILDTKIRRQAEVELTKQQAWEVVHLQAKDMGLTFNDAIVTLMNDFVAWMILAWKTDDWPCAIQLRQIRDEAESFGSNRANDIEGEILVVRMLLKLPLTRNPSSTGGGPSQTKKRRPRPRGTLRSSAGSLDDSSSEMKPRRIHINRRNKSTPVEAAGSATAAENSSSRSAAQDPRLTESFAKAKKVARHLSTLDGMLREVAFENGVLRNLFHENLDSREDAIQQADTNTFRWLIDESTALNLVKNKVDARKSLIDWLEKGKGVYHISGKPGSGKSTLFKLIANDNCTRNRLQFWAGENQLVVATFYFWNSGDQLQTSLEGLQRSILFQILRQVPDWIRPLFKRSWDKYINHGTKLDQVMIMDECIPEVWYALMSDGFLAKENRHICLFIDGLDEMTENAAVTFSLLAQILNTLTEKRANLKICVSSRPFRDFLKGFGSAQRLHLHDITAEDIRAMVTKTILDLTQRDEGGLQLTNGGEQLVDTIVEKSEGVFIWVRMALQQIRTLVATRKCSDKEDGLTEKMLERLVSDTLRTYPPGIDELYAHLLGQLHETELRSASMMLSLVKENPYRQLPNALWFHWIDELQRNVEFPAPGLPPYTALQVRGFHKQVEAKLDSLAKSLLKMHTDRRERKDGDRFYRKRVQFCHRTAQDYFDAAQAAGKFKGVGDLIPSHAKLIEAPSAAGPTAAARDTVCAQALVPIFQRLRLAEVALAGKYRDAPGADPRRRRVYSTLAQSLFSRPHPMGGMYQLGFPYMETLRKDLETTQQGKFGSAYLISCYQGISRSALTSEDPETAASFLHYTQYTGQWHYWDALRQPPGTSGLQEEEASKLRPTNKTPKDLQSTRHNVGLHMMTTTLFGWLLRPRMFGEVSMESFEERLPDMGDLMGWATVRPPISYDFLTDTLHKVSVPMIFASVAFFLEDERTNKFLEYLARGLRYSFDTNDRDANKSALNFIFLLEKRKGTLHPGPSPMTPTFGQHSDAGRHKPRKLLTRKVLKGLEEWIMSPIKAPAGEIMLGCEKPKRRPKGHPCGVVIKETHYTTLTQLVIARVLKPQLTMDDLDEDKADDNAVMRFLNAMPKDVDIAETVLDESSELFGNRVDALDLAGYSVKKIVNNDGVVLERGGHLCVRVY